MSASTVRLPSLWETNNLLCHAMHFLQLQDNYFVDILLYRTLIQPHQIILILLDLTSYIQWLYSFNCETGKDGSQDSRAPALFCCSYQFILKEPEGSTLSQFEDYLNVFKRLKSTISKSCRHIVNASKTVMSWDNKPVCNLLSSVLRSVYVICPWFCFMNFQRLERILNGIVQQVTFYQPNVIQFHYILQVVPLSRPDGRRSLSARYSLADSGSESTSESEEEIEVSKDRLGRLPA